MEGGAGGVGCLVAFGSLLWSNRLIYQFQHSCVPTQCCTTVVCDWVGMCFMLHLGYLSGQPFAVGHLIEYLLVFVKGSSSLVCACCRKNYLLPACLSGCL